MTDYPVEKSKPIQTRMAKYPFNQMEVDESFRFPIKERPQVSSAASQYGRRSGKTFKTRKMDNKWGRCWRTA